MTDQPTATRPPFLVRGVAAIKHLNVRKEGPDDEKILAVDVKMEIKNVDRRLCAYFDDALEAFLWRGNTDALIARNAFLVPVSYSNEISNANVTIGTRSYIGCDVKKFSMEPRDGGVMALTCSVALYPNSNDVADLAKLVQDEEHILIEGPPDLFAFPVPAATAGDAHDLLSADSDQMYEQVVDLVHKDRKASVSFVQRSLKLGYNRAARLIERMEADGYVSAMKSNGSREVLA